MTDGGATTVGAGSGEFDLSTLCAEFDAVLFDFDGTLVDTDDLNLRAAQAALAEFGARVPLEWCATAPMGTVELFREAVRRDHGVRLDCADRELVTAIRGHWLARRAELRPGPAAELARRLAAAGFSVGIVSANDGDLVHAGLREIELDSAVRFVVGRGEARAVKPAPDAYLRAAELLALTPARCLVFENTGDGIAAAHAAGMTVVDVRDWTTHRPRRPR